MRQTRNGLLWLVCAVAGCAHGPSSEVASATRAGRPVEVAATGNAGITTALPGRRSFHAPIVEDARKNVRYRDVIFTGARTQIALMRIPPGDDIGVETHARVEQIFVCVEGKGSAIVDGVETPFEAGDMLVVPPGARHDVRNVGLTPLRLYTIYSPPNHIDRRRHAIKADAQADADDEEFGRQVE